MLLNGTGIATIQRFFGHENIQTTEEYLDLGSEGMVQAVVEAEKELKGAEYAMSRPQQTGKIRIS